MEPGESNLQIMLRYRLARFNPQREKRWRVDLEWFTCKQHQGFTGSKVWGHIGKTWKMMVKIFTKFYHALEWSYSIPTYGGRMESNSSRNDFLTLGGWNSTARALDKWMMCGIAVKTTFYHGLMLKANSTSTQARSGNGKRSLGCLRRSGERSSKKTRTLLTPPSGSDFTKKGRRIPRW